MREPERREDGSGVGGGDDGAEQHGLEPREVEEHVRGEARQDGADDDADRAQERRGHRDLAQAAPRRLQAALVEDQREPDDADLPGELGIVELDPARAVGAEQHPDREEGREHGQPRSRGTEGDENAARQDAADEQKQKALVHAPIFPVRAQSDPLGLRAQLEAESRPPRGTLPGWRLDRARARWAGSRRSRRWPSGTASATSSSGTSSPMSFRGRGGWRRARSRPPARSEAGTCGRCSTSSARRSSSSASCSRPGPTSSRRTSSPSCVGSRTT